MNASPGDGRGAAGPPARPPANPPASPPATPSADQAAGASPELARINYGAWLIGAAFLLLGAARVRACGFPPRSS